MNRFRIVLPLIAAVGAAVFALRHHSLKQLQTQQVQWREEAEKISNGDGAASPAVAAPLNSTNAGLTEVEHRELLRLRGQVGQLRRELTLEANRAAAAPARTMTAAGDSEPIAPAAEATKHAMAGSRWATALMNYAEDHGHWPASLSEIEMTRPNGSADDVEFELLLSGLPARAAARTLLLRERQPWQGADGYWHRFYAFADGHGEVAQSDTPDFTRWEEKVKTRGGQAAR